METYAKHETCLLAKKKGFNLQLHQYYLRGGSGWSGSSTMNHNERGEFKCSRPSQSVLQKWLREVHNIHVLAVCTPVSTEHKIKYDCQLNGLNHKVDASYEEAMEHGLLTGLEKIEDAHPIKKEEKPSSGVFELTSENLSFAGQIGGGSHVNWRKSFSSLQKAKAYAERDFSKKINWKTKDDIITSGDLHYVMYIIEELVFED